MRVTLYQIIILSFGFMAIAAPLSHPGKKHQGPHWHVAPLIIFIDSSTIRSTGF